MSDRQSPHPGSDATGRKLTILLVPSFVVDTYSEIEQSFVELSAFSDPDVQFLWLVPEIPAKDNSFTNQENRKRLGEPLYVPHLRRYGIQYVVRNVSKYNLVSNFLLFRRLFKDYRIDGVYTHFGHERFWATFFGKLWGKVTIWNGHRHSLGTRHVLVKRLFYRLCVDYIISISEFITSTLPRSSRTHTVPNAINAVAPSDPSISGALKVRSDLGMKTGQKMVLMVAAFRTEKRHDLALEVCRRVSAARDDTIFVFLGDGPLRAAFIEKVRASGLHHRVHAPGHVHNVNDYYAATDLCILTSYYEPFGYCVLESMRFGVPVVAFDNGGPAEVIRDDDTGVLVKEADTAGFESKILSLLSDDSTRRSMGQSAIESIKRDYSREIWVRRITTVLRECVNGAEIPRRHVNA